MGTITKLLLSSLLLSSTLSAIEWKSYQEALEIQKTTHQPIMIDVMRTDCHYCSDMEKKVFNDSAMSEWLTQRFIPVKINLDTDTMPIDQKVTFTPTFFFLDGQGQILKTIPGSWNIQDFKDLTKGIK